MSPYDYFIGLVHKALHDNHGRTISRETLRDDLLVRNAYDDDTSVTELADYLDRWFHSRYEEV